MAIPSIHVLSLFSGVGGLDLALRIALPQSRVVCYVEGEVYAAAVLAARMAEGAMDDAPIWSDVRTFDGRPWRGIVDLIIGGFPCQDISNAGNREGIGGKHSGLWCEFTRIIREVGPSCVFVENVSALLIRGIDCVLGDLASMGFDAEWGVFSAAEVGAPHLRKRVFILANASERGRRAPVEDTDARRGEPDAAWGGAAMADPSRDGRRERGAEPTGLLWGSDATLGSSSLAHPGFTGLAGRTGFGGDAGAKRQTAQRGGGHVALPEGGGFGGDLRESGATERPARGHQSLHCARCGGPATCKHLFACRRWFCTDCFWNHECEPAGDDVADPDDLSGPVSQANQSDRADGGFAPGAGYAGGLLLFPPGPNDIAGWVRVPQEAQPCIRGVADVVANRVDRLRACGNGVVALQGAAAFRVLAARFARLGLPGVEG